MLTKRSNGVAQGPRLKKALAGVIGGSMDRRTFLKRTGITAGGAGLAAATPLGVAKPAKAAVAAQSMKQVKSVCTHCSARAPPPPPAARASAAARTPRATSSASAPPA